ncbi:hypothetical protein FNV43_RR17653 [Rhamnella rubrinervis]|uniref:Pentatricopeptide repeat-containing protein n=1 Tax=Rhamnella rubrinervis TaxID=2594499 RepID=A0A8K0GVK1_9ROSA|nr:hypothetical protein FNV43_RR17653 [Rhamnella rubrinervis]
MLRNALQTNLNLLSKFIVTCASVHLIRHARRVFDHRPHGEDSFLCNSMIKAHFGMRQFTELFTLYRDLRRDTDFVPDNYTFILLAKSCALNVTILEGEGIHSQVVKNGFCLNLYVSTALVDMYARFGMMDCAGKLFNEMSERSEVSWTALICGFARTGDMVNARKLFDEMPLKDSAAYNVMIDGYVKSGIMGSARNLFEEMKGRNVVSWTSMIYGYCHSGNLQSARSLFDAMPEKNLISWNTIIAGYCKNKQPHEALKLFHEMQATTAFEPDEVTIVSILPAIADLGALDLGSWVHQFVKRKKLDKVISVCTALVDMYAKCGEITKAKRIFHEMPEKETAPWNALIYGLAVNGCGKEALDMFLEMQQTKFKPNGITMLSVLSACNHSGLVEEGKKWFKEMEKFKLVPQIEHYGCMIDLLGRSGCLEEAEKLISSMPYKANEIILSSFLFACGYSQDVTRAKKVLSDAIKLDPGNAGNYVAVRNLYAAERRWNDVEEIKGLMKKNGSNKEVGCSFIEVDGVIREFVAGNTLHPCWGSMHLTLEQFWKHMKGEIICNKRVDCF